MISAELRRNLWLEVSLTRLMAIPVLLGLVFWGLSSLRGTFNPQFLAGTAQVLFTLVCSFWGAYLVSSSITEEAQAQTWDWQRLSSQSPVELMAGKLFGSTVLAWYGGAWCLAAYLAYTIMSGDLHSVSWLILLPASAVFIQAGSMLMTLGIPPEQRPEHQQKRGMGILRLLVIILVLQGVAGLGAELTGSSHRIQWYGVDAELLSFVAISAVIWAGWAVFGCVQRLSTLLRCPTTPTPWLLFAVWCSLYFAGFAHGFAQKIGVESAVSDASSYSLTVYVVTLSLALLMVLQEEKSPVLWRMWFSALHGKKYFLAWQRTPRWVATTAMSIIALGYAAKTLQLFSPWMLVALLLLFLRDAAVLYSFYWTPKRSRPQLAFAIYILLVYLLLPYLLEPLTPVLLPDPGSMALSISGFCLEAALAVTFCVYRWKAFYRG